MSTSITIHTYTFKLHGVIKHKLLIIYIIVFCSFDFIEQCTKLTKYLICWMPLYKLKQSLRMVSTQILHNNPLCLILPLLSLVCLCFTLLFRFNFARLRMKAPRFKALPNLTLHFRYGALPKEQRLVSFHPIPILPRRARRDSFCLFLTTPMMKLISCCMWYLSKKILAWYWRDF